MIEGLEDQVEEDARIKGLKSKWWKKRVLERHIQDLGYDTAERWELERCEVWAKERGMTLDQFLDYEFYRYGQEKLQENQSAREAHGFRLLTEGHSKEGLYMLEALLEEGYTTKHFPMNLAKAYRKLKRLEDEVRVLERGIYLFEHRNEDWHPLDRFGPWCELNAELLRQRLEKTKVLLAKAAAKKK